MGKDKETEELIYIFLTSIKTAPKETESVIQCLTSRFSTTNKIKLRSAATSLFDVQRWKFDVHLSIQPLTV